MANDVVLVTTGKFAGSHGDDDSPEAIRRRKVADLLSKARKQFKTVMEAEASMRAKMLEDLQFVASDQWDMSVRADRAMDQRPCLTINRLPQFIRQVTGQTRAGRPAVKVNPVDNGADVQTAEVYQGIIQHIELQSDAQAAYITASEAQARTGRGYVYVTTEFRDPMGFDQDIKIKRVRNPFTVVMDIAIEELDASDARFCFIIEDIPKDSYKQRFGDASMASLTEFAMNPAERASDWMPEGKIRTAAYYYIDFIEDELLLVRWGDGHEQVTLKSLFDQWPMDQQILAKIARKRPTQRKQVKVALINAVEILEGNEDKSEGAIWPGSRIPVVPAYGEEIDVNGDVDLRGVVRDAKDSQRMYNYQNTALAEALALAPKAPYVGYTGQFEGHEDKWRQANRRNFPYLEANPISVNGTLAGLPRREAIDPGVGAIVQAIAQADNDLKATTGLYDPSLGQRQPDQSGRAIMALQKQGEVSTSNFADGIARMVRGVGRILIEIIPRIYDTPRVLRIIGDDKKERTLMVHAQGAGGPDPNALPPGVENIYDLSTGRYDIAVSVGPSTESKRQEAVQGLSSIVQANPAAFQLLGDIIVENMDWPGSQAAAKRLKKALPPQLQDDSPESQIPPQVQAQMQQMQEQAQQLQQQLAETQQELQKAQSGIAVKQMQVESQEQMQRERLMSDERREQLRGEIQLMLEKVKLQSDLAKADHEARLGMMSDAQGHQHEAQMSAIEREHEARKGAIEHAQSLRASAFEHDQSLKQAEHAQAITPPEPQPQAPLPESVAPIGPGGQ